MITSGDTPKAAHRADRLGGFHRLDDRIVAELIKRMSLLLKSVVLSVLILPIAIGVVLWGKVNHVQLITWAMIETGWTIHRYLLARRYLHLDPPVSEARRWARRYTVNVFGSGLTWGIGGMLFFVDGSMPHQMLIIAIIIGIAGGSLFNTSFWPQTMYAYATPAVGLTALRVAMEDSLPHQTMAGIMIFYLFMLYQMVNQGHRINVDAINLKFENLDLIEQLKEQKEIAEQANVAKSKFLAAASHDLRQPLHALGLFASALDERIRFPDVRVLVNNINQSVSALEGLFNALLDISRLDAGIIQPKLVHFKVRDLIERLQPEYAAQARQKGLQLHTEGEDVAVYSDPTLVETMLRNLIGNALRFTQSGSVAVSWHSDGTQVRIDVRDTGIGISETESEHIFQEFLQLHNPERDRSKGLGLGLAIVKRLSALLHSTITVQSTPGKGSLFKLTLPLGDTARISTERTAEMQQLESDPAMHVLVIDDELAIRDAMTTLLQNWGHQVTAVSSLDEAQQALQQAPDAIIADYRLREARTGIEAIRTLHQTWGSDIPTLIITGDTAPERLREAQDSGYSFMHKPVNAAKLRAFLRTANRTTNAPERGSERQN
jgi:signal transduction histidine kinase/ActR/RegA family two-component response regulator